MLPQTELKIFSNLINLTLLNDIIAFVLGTSEADYAQKKALSTQCIFLDDHADGGAFQKKYGFLYLGELLERYEARFQTSIQDFRAIALALGYTRDIVNDSMFIGSQRADFMRGLSRRANGDLYLTGALYLLQPHSGKDAVTENKLIYEYSTAEELIFAVSLLQDNETVFPRIKEQLLRLLGGDRSMPVLGNMKALDWLITWLIPHIKTARGKDLALLRALAALPTSFVKPESKPYAVLVEHGYTPLEIAYANMMSVQSQTAAGVLHPDSIVTEKIVIALFQAVLGSSEPLTAEAYDLLSDIYRRYDRFQIRCYGCSTLTEALDDAPHASNTETFFWFSKLAGIQHRALNGFDILDSKWDALASVMDLKDYQRLFEFGLNDTLSTEEIHQRINRHDALTGTSYLAVYQSRHNGSHFGLLVSRKIIDLWEEFQASLDSNRNIVRPDVVTRIHNYAYNLPSIYAYQFYEKVIETYGVQGLDRFFGRTYNSLYSTLVRETRYSNSGRCDLTLNIDRDFLDDAQRRQLLIWLEEYIFLCCPKKYLPFVTAILSNEAVAGLFPAEDQRALFDLVMKRPASTMAWDVTANLKRRYLTEEEKAAEESAAAAAEQKAEQQRRSDMEQSLKRKYSEKTDGTFSFDKDFLERLGHGFTRHGSLSFAAQIVMEHLNENLSRENYRLTSDEAACFLSVCSNLMEQKVIQFQEVQKYILEIKEVVGNAGDPN